MSRTQQFPSKMAEYINVFRRALGQLGGHGGIRGLLLQLVRCVFGQDVIPHYCEVPRYFYVCGSKGNHTDLSGTSQASLLSDVST